MAQEHEDRVRKRAYTLWEDEGRPEGGALHHWLAAEKESGGDDARDTPEAAHPNDVDQAAGPSHGDADFGGHDIEAEGAAAAGVGGSEPKQAGTNKAEVGEQAVRSR